jgi:hypothetical protein
MEQLRQMGNSPQIQQMMEQIQRQMVETRQQGRGGEAVFQFQGRVGADGTLGTVIQGDRIIVRPAETGRGGRVGGRGGNQ